MRQLATDVEDAFLTRDNRKNNVEAAKLPTVNPVKLADFSKLEIIDAYHE